MSAGQYEGGEEVFTLAEIQQALVAEGEGRIVREVVTGAMEKYAEARKQAEIDQHRLDVTKDICVSYRRTTSYNSSNIEGWVSSLHDGSLRFLGILASDKDRPLSELDEATRDAAAAAHVYLGSFYGEFDVEPLEDAGVDTGALLEFFKTGLQEVLNPDRDPEILRKIAQTEDLNTVVSHIAQGGLPAWEVYMGRRILKVTEMLESAGVQLPALGPDGRYDAER